MKKLELYAGRVYVGSWYGSERDKRRKSALMKF